MREGGWIPVIHRRGRQVTQVGSKEGRRQEMYSLFVDNLPDSMEPRRMFDLFRKFGLVKDVYIPHKRRKTTNTRFGFVRFDCPVAVSVAEQKTNGLWVDDKALIVQSVAYGKGKDDKRRFKQMQWRPTEVGRQPGTIAPKRWNQGLDGRSYVEVIKGVQPRGHSTPTIRVEEIGNGWLYESLIMRLKPMYSVAEVKAELKVKGVKDVVVREGGGRDIVITFRSREALRSMIGLIKEWFHAWCVYITEWEPGIHLQQERCAWISCFAVPLNLWNSDTFRKIGRIWGEVISLDPDLCNPTSFRCGMVKIVTTIMEVINTNLNLECSRSSSHVVSGEEAGD